MEIGTGCDMATQSPSSVVMVLADAPPEPSRKSSPSHDTTAAAHVAQESNGSQRADLCVAKKKGGVNAAAAPLPPRSDPPDAPAEAPATPKTPPQTPASSLQYVSDNADHIIAKEQQDEDGEEDGDSSSSSSGDEEEYERTPTSTSQFLPPDTTDAYQESPVKFRPVVVLEKESQRSPRKKLMADASQNEYGEGGKRAAAGLESIGLPTIDEAMMGPSLAASGTKSGGTRPPLSGGAAGKTKNRTKSRRSTASGSKSSSRGGGSGRTSTTNTPGGDILTAILDRTLTLMGCASTSNAFGCGRTGSKKSAASCQCGSGADDQVLWDGDVDDTATVNSVHVPSPRASPRASPKQMADLNGRVQIQMRSSAAVGDTCASGTVAHQAARAAAAAASGQAHNKTNPNTKSRGMGCTGTGGKYVASSPLTTTVPFDANDLSTIVPDASDAHHLPTATTTTTTAAGEGGDGSAASPKGGTKDDDDEALLSPTHFFRPVSFDIDESSLAGSIAGSLASAIRGAR